VGQRPLVHFPEANFLKKLYLVRENEDAVQSQSTGLGNASLHKFSANALILIWFPNRQRSDLGQVFPTDVHAARADDFRLIVIQVDKNIPKVVIQFTQGTRQHIAALGVAGQHFLNFTDLINPRFPNLV
jgi:hypothetical protein